MAEPIMEVPETIHSPIAHLEEPNAAHHIKPATATTAASQKGPVKVAPASDANSISSDVVHPRRVVKQVHRPPKFPPLPDLRFEHNFNASLKGADTWGKVAWIILRDQVIFPFVQGTLWTLALTGWRHWNRNASLSGQTIGSRIRRWWYGVNNWKLPPISTDQRLAAQDSYQAQFSDASA